MNGRAAKFTLGLLLAASTLVSGIGASASSPNYYHTSGNRIVDSGGTPATFNGINWFGFETSNFSPHGLWTRSMDSMLDQMKTKGYNLLRIPYTNEMFLPGKMPNSIDYVQNPDLQGLTPIQILDKLIEKAGSRGMKVFLDRHRPTAAGQSEQWYTSTVSEATWIDDWKMLAQRYLGNDTVIGADLHNEPHGNICWGCGDQSRDWRLAAERAGNAILGVNPNWLIIVEGVDANVQGQSGSYWWGGNLKGVQDNPVRLNVANRVVYSPHDYGPGVSNQPWFSDASFPSNMPAIWDAYWGYIHKNNIAPILAGEFGGRSVDTASVEGKWQNALVDYLKANDMYWTYWCVNPNSGDTGGLLLDDWTTWNQPKQDMLNRLMKALPGGGGGSPTVPAAPTGLVATAGDGQITLGWSASAGAASYSVKRATVNGGPYTTVASGLTSPGYADTGLTNGTAYYYVVSASNSAGESANSSQLSVSPSAGGGTSSTLALQYKAGDTNPGDNQFKPHFRIVNNGTAAVPLSSLKIRYWYTIDGVKPQTFNCDYANVGCANVNGQLVPMSTAKTGADYYLEISFGAGAGSVAAGGNTGDLMTRNNKNDWTNYNESDDYSFDATKTAYTNWSKVTLYQNGTLVWGTEP